MENPELTELDLDLRTKVGWAKFFYSMILRSPEYLQRAAENLQPYLEACADSARADYDRLRGPNEPTTFAEFQTKFLSNPMNTSPNWFLHRLIDSERVIRCLTEMRWWTVTFRNPKHLLLTSDRPVIMTNGVGRPDAHIAMPIGPTKLFFATRSDKVRRQVASMDQNDLIRNSNTKVVEQARKFVYGFSDAQISFVSGRLGKMVPATPLETAAITRPVILPLT